MLRELIQNTYGSRKGFLRYQLDALLQKIGFYRLRLPPSQEINRVVFVCHGNICRSALAEMVFKKHSLIKVGSVGLDTTTGKPANPRLLKCATETAGIDLTAHRTTRLEDYEVQPGDLFVCMEIRQIRTLKKRGYTNSSVLLGAFGEKKLARINDPYSANDQYMKKAVGDIVYHTVELANSLKG